jgi:hypothetical protein
MSSSLAVLSLYRQMLKGGRSFKEYNVSSWITRRVRDEFRRNMHEKEADKLTKLITRAQMDAGVIERQGAISKLYNKDQSVMRR